MIGNLSRQSSTVTRAITVDFSAVPRGCQRKPNPLPTIEPVILSRHPVLILVTKPPTYKAVWHFNSLLG
jgi:hypothetical protein